MPRNRSIAVHLSKLEALKINVLTTGNGAYPFTSGQKMKMHPVSNRSIAVHFSVFLLSLRQRIQIQKRNKTWQERQRT